MNLSIAQVLTSLSFTLDYLEIDMRNNVTNHNKRLAYIAGAIGELYGFSQGELSDLYMYSLLHDNGVAKAFPHNTGSLNRYQVELKKAHCIIGEKNIANFPFLKKRENVILYHHERADGTGLFEIPIEEVDIFSQIIHLADAIELLYSSGIKPKEIKENINSLVNIYFSRELINIFYELTLTSEFWLSMDNIFLDKSFLKKIPQIHTAKSYGELIPVAQVYANIIDGKSSFTLNHSTGFANKAALLANYYGFNNTRTDKIILAALLHDLGKLILSKAILDKPGKLTQDEYTQVKYHTFYTRKALETIEGFEDITEWASNHHEKLNGSGYPLGHMEEQLDFESRMFACLDIYQALTEERPHRARMNHEEALKILEKMAASGEIQSSIVKDIKEVFRDEGIEAYEL